MYFDHAPKHMIWLSIEHQQDSKIQIQLWKSLVGDTPNIHKRYLKETADELNEPQIHSLPAGDAYEQQWYSVYRCKQSSAALMNTTLICIVQRQDEKKIPRKLF